MSTSHVHRLWGLLIFVRCRIFFCACILVRTKPQGVSAKNLFRKSKLKKKKMDNLFKRSFFKLFVTLKVVDSHLFEILSKSMSGKWAKNPILLAYQ